MECWAVKSCVLWCRLFSCARSCWGRRPSTSVVLQEERSPSSGRVLWTNSLDISYNNLFAQVQFHGLCGASGTLQSLMGLGQPSFGQSGSQAGIGQAGRSWTIAGKSQKSKLVLSSLLCICVQGCFQLVILNAVCQHVLWAPKAEVTRGLRLVRVCR